MNEPEGAAERDRAIVDALGAWFDASARDLPWRRDRTPYAVWVSEIMLQQTRVETVVPYFERFLRRFPDARALADAPLEAVLERWSGLGYYRRARQLHLAAREVTDRYGGALPPDVEGLRSLPGVGAYTAGAIASLAFGTRAPLVDGNVARVLARIEGIDDPIKRADTVKRLWSVAARMVPADAPGRFNEALMELGATVCTPRDPRCDACPVARFCEAKRTGRERLLPVVEGRAKVPEVIAVALVVADPRGRVLFAKRTDGGLFGGLWEPPIVEGTSSIPVAKRALGALARGRLVAAGELTRVLSHRRMRITVVVGKRAMVEDETRQTGATGLPAPYERVAWLDPRAPEVGVSTLARKVLDLGLAAPAAEKN